MGLSTFIVEVKIYKCFDNFISLETLFKFFCISRAFEWVWHEGLVCELKNLEICDNLQSVLGNGYQSVARKGQILIGSWLKPA